MEQKHPPASRVPPGLGVAQPGTRKRSTSTHAACHKVVQAQQIFEQCLLWRFTGAGVTPCQQEIEDAGMIVQSCHFQSAFTFLL